MVSFFRALISSGPVYVRIRRDWLSVKDVKTGKRYEDIPAVAIKENSGVKTVSAIGKNADTELRKSPEDTIVVNGFHHPRLIVHDYVVAEKTLIHFFGEIFSAKFIRPAPIVIMHVTEELEGGITPIEVRVLRELAAGAGAREVYVWSGRELSDGEILNGNYKGKGWLSD